MKFVEVCRTYRALGLVLAGLVLASPAQAAWYWPFGDKQVDYSVQLNGTDSEVTAWLDELKLDKPDQDRVLADVSELEQELSVRGGRVRQALEAVGYYDAVIQQRVGEVKGKHVLVYDIQQGPRYTVGKVTFAWGGGKPLQGVNDALLKTKVGEPIQAKVILEDALAVLNAVGKQACVLELDVAPLVKIFDGTSSGKRRGEVVFRIRRGVAANFGPTVVSGTTRVSKDVVVREVTWHEGDCYRESEVDATRQNLIQNQLFSTVEISHPIQPDAKGEVPMTVAVRERAARTLRAGASFSSDDGVVLSSGWEHRNLWGNGEKFTTGVSFGQHVQSLNTNLRLPNIWADKQTLVLRGSVSHEDRDSYTANTLDTGASLERKLAPHWKGGLGVGFTLTKTNDVGTGINNYGLVSLPAFLEYDTRNDVLNPKRGVFSNLSVTPYTETFGDGGQFLKTQGSVQTYVTGKALPLSPTLALKVAGGTIMGAKGQDVPSSIRYYAGGGGSVRGYGYQTLGPRVNGAVVGGSSFVAGSAEARLRFTDEFGGVAFMDAGNAFDTSLPDNGAKLYTSAGVGVRYFTAIGPIRADVGVPLNGKDIGAAGYALYISIGQSF